MGDWAIESVARRAGAREVCYLVITRLMTFAGQPLEPLAREPIGLLTQSLLEKYHE
jgi:hypothetical protein